MSFLWLVAMDWEMVCRRRLVVLFVHLPGSGVSRWIFWLCAFFSGTRCWLLRPCPLRWFGVGVRVRDEGECLLLFLVARRVLRCDTWPRCLAAFWCGLTLVVSCPLFGFQPLHAQLLAVATLLQLVLVGVYVFSIVGLVVRSLTGLEGYVQSKGESKRSFWQILMFLGAVFPGPEFLFSWLCWWFLDFFGSGLP